MLRVNLCIIFSLPLLQACTFYATWTQQRRLLFYSLLPALHFFPSPAFRCCIAKLRIIVLMCGRSWQKRRKNVLKSTESCEFMDLRKTQFFFSTWKAFKRHKSIEVQNKPRSKIEIRYLFFHIKPPPYCFIQKTMPGVVANVNKTAEAGLMSRPSASCSAIPIMLSKEMKMIFSHAQHCWGRWRASEWGRRKNELFPASSQPTIGA